MGSSNGECRRISMLYMRWTWAQCSTLSNYSPRQKALIRLLTATKPISWRNAPTPTRSNALLLLDSPTRTQMKKGLRLTRTNSRNPSRLRKLVHRVFLPQHLHASSSNPKLPDLPSQYGTTTKATWTIECPFTPPDRVTPVPAPEQQPEAEGPVVDTEDTNATRPVIEPLVPADHADLVDIYVTQIC